MFENYNHYKLSLTFVERPKMSSGQQKKQLLYRQSIVHCLGWLKKDGVLFSKLSTPVNAVMAQEMLTFYVVCNRDKIFNESHLIIATLR